MSIFQEQSRRAFLGTLSRSFVAGAVLAEGSALQGLSRPGDQEQQTGRLVIGQDSKMASPGQDELNYFFAGIVSATTDPDGNIYACDWRAVEVRKYSPDGRFIQMMRDNLTERRHEAHS